MWRGRVVLEGVQLGENGGYRSSLEGSCANTQCQPTKQASAAKMAEGSQAVAGGVARA